MKPYHEMTAGERTADRIRKNREIECASGADRSWTLNEIVAILDSRKQRAIYGAVAAIVGRLARGLMSGRSRCPMDSWVVAASGVERGWTSGYSERQIHPDCLRQIRLSEGNIIEDPERLALWLAHPQAHSQVVAPPRPLN